MKDCQCDTCEAVCTDGNVSGKAVNAEMRFINKFLEVEGPAIDYGTDHEMYEHLKANQEELGIFVSDKHVKDEDVETTFYVIAKSEKDYEEYEEDYMHQHDPEATLGVETEV